jgi:hypothetical protein
MDMACSLFVERKRMRRMFTALATLFLVAACSTPPVKLTNFEDQSMRRFDNRKLSVVEVLLDIQMAAAKTGWEIRPGAEPGHIKATHVDDDKSSATVEIVYDANNYSITYVSSVNMGYVDSCKSSESGGLARKCIDPKYNTWVAELNKTIASELQD